MTILPSDPKVQKKLLVAIVPLLLLVAFWYFFHSPEREELERLESRVEQLEGKNAAARASAMQGGPELEETLALYEDQILRLEELVPRTNELPELLYDLTLRAQEIGVELARLNPHEPEEGAFYTLHGYDVAVVGSYHDIGRYLAAIGSLPRIVTSYNLSLQPRQDRDRVGSTKLQAEFQIKTYALPSIILAAS